MYDESEKPDKRVWWWLVIYLINTLVALVCIFSAIAALETQASRERVTLFAVVGIILAALSFWMERKLPYAK